MIKKRGLKFGTHYITRPNVVLYRKVDYPVDPVTEMMHFIYLANDYDGTKIPNRAINSTVGDYLKSGNQISKNDSGWDCYLTNNNDNFSYLYTRLSINDRNLMKADSGTYTFFVRVMQDMNTDTGGIITWRFNDDSGPGDDYNYMIRCVDHKLQIHFGTGEDTGIYLTSDKVIKIQVSGNNFTVTDLNSGTTWQGQDDGQKGMSRIMASFVGMDGAEPYLDRFYAIAGIARATTSEEDSQISNYLMRQGTDETPAPEPEPEPSDLWWCDYCGTENDGGDTCSNCGESRYHDEPISQNWYCESCGAENNEINTYCSQCGASRYDEEEDYWTCEHCGTGQIGGDSCSDCGEPRYPTEPEE